MTVRIILFKAFCEVSEVITLVTHHLADKVAIYRGNSSIAYTL